jgi:hypothetical protein
MKTGLRLSALLLVLGAGAGLQGTALAQTPAPGRTTAAPVACPTPADMQGVHLYGLWRAQFEGLPTGATLLFERNPDHPDGVRGQVRREDAQGRVRMDWVAGDVDDGDFTLEESADGRSIAATWIGAVSEDSCGKEIRGTWTPARGSASHPFVLRKQPGW